MGVSISQSIIDFSALERIVTLDVDLARLRQELQEQREWIVAKTFLCQDRGCRVMICRDKTGESQERIPRMDKLPPSPQEVKKSCVSTKEAGGVKNRGFARLERLLLWTSSSFFLLVLYASSLGPVMRHYRDHPPARIPGVVAYVAHGPRPEKRRTVIFPRWIHIAYYPMFRLLGDGQHGLGGFYARYWVWWVDGEAACLRNLRRLDEAKRKWAAETHKADGETPFAAHIVDYLPNRSMPKCPNGGDYRFNEVGRNAQCSVH